MNSEDKIHSKIKNASHKGEKDFPGMDKVWNRVEEKLDNTIVVQKKNTWQKLAIAATVLLSFSIIYQFVSNDEIIKEKVITNDTENPIIVSNDSVKKIMNKTNEVVVDYGTAKKQSNPTKKEIKNYISDESYEPETDQANYKYYPGEFDTLPTGKLIDKRRFLIDYSLPLEEKDKITTELNKGFFTTYNEISMRNSASNFVSSNTNNGILAPSKKYDVATKVPKSKFESKKSKTAVAPVQQNKDLVVIDGVAMDKNHNAEEELANLNAEDIDTTILANPLYIINGIEYSEESLFGKNPTSPYAPLDKQRITSTSILKPADATKIYGKKGENGIVIITTKDGKPAEK
jgi:hypothetical protein